MGGIFGNGHRQRILGEGGRACLRAPVDGCSLVVLELGW